jgi:nucleotide-binding universal stress UspA family protein
MTTKLPDGQEHRAGARRAGAPVVVGADGPESDLAVEWAADEAVSRGVPLRVVRTWNSPPAQPWSAVADPTDTAAMRAGSERIAHRALRIAREHVPGVDADAVIGRGPAADFLIETGRRAGLLVLGSRRLNLVQRIFAGVSEPVSAEAPCPTVVVNGPAETSSPDAAVVVGVADRPGDADILAFAFEYAARHRLSVRAVLCWPHDPLATAQWRGESAEPERAARLLAETMAGWREQYPDVLVHAGVERGRPAHTLVAASTAQALLVVGREPHHLTHGAVRESVSRGVLHHATCPVAVVPTR